MVLIKLWARQPPPYRMEISTHLPWGSRVSESLQGSLPGTVFAPALWPGPRARAAEGDLAPP